MVPVEPLDVGYSVRQYEIHRWEPAFAITFERDSGRVVVWIGTADVLANDMGGWLDVALGISDQGALEFYASWPDTFPADLDQPDWTGDPLAAHIAYAEELALYAAQLMPVIIAAKQEGATIREVVELLEASAAGHVLIQSKIALAYLWRSEVLSPGTIV